MKNKKKIKLKEIDLSKRKKGEHPDIRENTYYLAKIYNGFYAGTFRKQWYGWNFNAVYDAGKQLWTTGLSEKGKDGWQKLYEIINIE